MSGVLRATGALAAAAATAGAAAATYGTLVEQHWYRLRRVRVPGALRSPTPRPLRILHVSDLHLDPPQAERVEFLERLGDHDVDLAVATGDLLGSEHAEDATVDALAPLTADGTPGLVVLGSHDLFAPTPKSPLSYFTRPEMRVHGPPLNTGRLVRGLSGRGWTVLRDDATVVDTPLGRIAAGGIDDPHLSETVLPRMADVHPDGEPPEGRGADGSPRDCPEGHLLHLGLTHAPYRTALDLLVDADHDLLLAGHTHGGQVRIPVVGALTTNCDLPRYRARGLSRWRGAWLHVSPGLGTSPFAPFRFACRPEATILEVTA